MLIAAAIFINVFPALKGEDFSGESLTFQAVGCSEPQ
jgi:hypothetical protein